MRLIIHNGMICNKNKCRGSLNLKIKKYYEEESEFDIENVKKQILELDWNLFYKTMVNNNYLDLPIFIDNFILKNEKYLKKIHYFLEELIIEEGSLICETCLNKYEIKDTIINFL